MELSNWLCPMALCSAIAISAPVSAQDYPYQSLEEFCVATQADTPANCACGQATAEELLTDEEMQLVLGLMLRDAAAMARISELRNHEELMAKLSKITQGCA